MLFTPLVTLSLAALAAAGPIPRDNGNHGHGHGHGNNGNDNDNGHGKGHHSHSDVTPNELYQYSALAALSAGAASHGVLLKEIAPHGDLGLGTYPKIAGEMIILDGVIYRATANETIDVPDVDTTETPFAAITKFEPTVNTAASFANYSDFTAQLPSFFDSPVENHFISFRLDGTFDVRVRAPGGQCFDLEPISAVVDRQTEFEYAKIEGTMVGFRTPKYAGTINQAGDHLHFISSDRTRGGHVLSWSSVGELSVQAAKLDQYTVVVPEEGQWDEVVLA